MYIEREKLGFRKCTRHYRRTLRERERSAPSANGFECLAEALDMHRDRFSTKDSHSIIFKYLTTLLANNFLRYNYLFIKGRGTCKNTIIFLFHF